jgi:hypothetical protein
MGMGWWMLVWWPGEIEREEYQRRLEDLRR